MRDSRLCSNGDCEHLSVPAQVASGRAYCSLECREDGERRAMRRESEGDRLMVPSGEARRWLEGRE